jgi:hypothetical protein
MKNKNLLWILALGLPAVYFLPKIRVVTVKSDILKKLNSNFQDIEKGLKNTTIKILSKTIIDNNTIRYILYDKNTEALNHWVTALTTGDTGGH